MPDTIIALATPPGVSALACLRVCGPGSLAAVDALLAKPHEWKPRHAAYLTLADNGTVLDDVVALYFAGPKSYTGEDTVELTCHGNPLIIQRVLTALLRHGARMARPGEFTQLAFLNGKMDLTQSEAVRELIEAGTEHALEGARALRDGKLSEPLHTLRQRLIDTLAHLEAFIDFPDEDITPETGDVFIQTLRGVLETVERLLATAPLGRVLREGAVVAIVGDPNVGKSSLLNALLRENRAIVSPTPGTTRDTIEAECNLRGFRVRLIDTAGQRETNDAIEAEGVRRAQQAAARADVILHVIDGTLPLSQHHTPEPELIPGQRLLRLANKSDQGVLPEHSERIAVSTQSSTGLEMLETALHAELTLGSDVAQQGWLTINARHENALHHARTSLLLALEGLEAHTSPEFVSTDVRAALHAIGDVIGLATNEDILDSLFKQFCIGK